VRRVLSAAAAAALLAGCGGTAKLDSDDARRLATARAELDDAIDTEETLRTDPEEARRLVGLVRRRLGGPPNRVEEVVPSLVDSDGRLDGRAVRSFLRYAEDDAPMAMLPPAEEAVETSTGALEDADADTKIPTLENRTAEAYLEEAERDTRPIWPDLADRLSDARGDL
jgi:outer membrane murein-binding lipoprotein Lpp